MLLCDAQLPNLEPETDCFRLIEQPGHLFGFGVGGDSGLITAGHGVTTASATTLKAGAKTSISRSLAFSTRVF